MTAKDCKEFDLAEFEGPITHVCLNGDGTVKIFDWLDSNEKAHIWAEFAVKEESLALYILGEIGLKALLQQAIAGTIARVERNGNSILAEKKLDLPALLALEEDASTDLDEAKFSEEATQDAEFAKDWALGVLCRDQIALVLDDIGDQLKCLPVADISFPRISTGSLLPANELKADSFCKAA